MLAIAFKDILALPLFAVRVYRYDPLPNVLFSDRPLTPPHTQDI